MKSRWAQLGAHAGDISDQIARVLRDLCLTNQAEGGLIGSFLTKMDVFNFGNRSIEIPKGAGLFRFYHVPNFITGERTLEELRLAGFINIQGEQGRDWKITPEGILLRIENPRWIPPGNDNSPVTLRSKGNYRGEIDALLETAPETQKSILWIGNTPSVRLSGVEGVLDWMAVAQDPAESYRDKRGLQISSHLIDDRSDWPIRVEIISPTVSERRPEYVLLRLAAA